MIEIFKILDIPIKFSFFDNKLVVDNNGEFNIAPYNPEDWFYYSPLVINKSQISSSNIILSKIVQTVPNINGVIIINGKKFLINIKSTLNQQHIADILNQLPDINAIYDNRIIIEFDGYIFMNNIQIFEDGLYVTESAIPDGDYIVIRNKFPLPSNNLPMLKFFLPSDKNAIINDSYLRTIFDGMAYMLDRLDILIDSYTNQYPTYLAYLAYLYGIDINSISVDIISGPPVTIDIPDTPPQLPQQITLPFIENFESWE